jgi:hypothetical protein
VFQLSESDQEKLLKKIRTYKGDMSVLESAIGALVIGQQYGWRVIRMGHSNVSLTKYEKILVLKFKNVCPEYTDISERNVGVKLAKKLNAYWKVLQGRVPNQGKAMLQ